MVFTYDLAIRAYIFVYIANIKAVVKILLDLL